MDDMSSGSPVIVLEPYHYSRNTALPSISKASVLESGPVQQGSTNELNAVTGSPMSPSEVAGLRVEVENLRRVMQDFQVDRIEPPPTYHEGD